MKRLSKGGETLYKTRLPFIQTVSGGVLKRRIQR